MDWAMRVRPGSNSSIELAAKSPGGVLNGNVSVRYSALAMSPALVENTDEIAPPLELCDGRACRLRVRETTEFRSECQSLYTWKPTGLLYITYLERPNPAMHRRLIQRPRDAFQIVNFLMQPQLITDTEGSHDRRRLGSI